MAPLNFEEILSQDSAIIDKDIEKIIPKTGGVPNVNDAIWYMLSSGGKRLRPAVSIECVKALNGNINAALRFGVAVELVHNYLLIHDDIEDGDTVRRNLPAIWVKYGLPHGINIGDYVSSKVYESILSIRELGLPEKKILDLFGITIQCLVDTGEGQAMEITARSGNDLSIDEYMKITQMKTGAYLALPIAGAAIITGLSSEIFNSIKLYGDFIGPAFQIADDILDIVGGKGRCEIGCDIKEGKRSFMVVYTASVCSVSEKTQLFEILNKARELKTASEVDWVIQLFNKYNAVEKGRKESESLIVKGKNRLSNVPVTLRNVLNEFADYAVRRLR